MANLIYNGIEITIENKQVSLTNLYAAIGNPPNKAPTNFRTSKEGKQKINKYVTKHGTWVWTSRRGVDTTAIVELACEYLEYLGDPNAARKLWEVYKNGQNIEYNTQNITQNIEYNTQNITQNIEYNTENPNQLQDDPSQKNTSSGCGCIIALIITMFFAFASFNSNKDRYDHHQYDPPAAQPYYNYPPQ
ncbi:MULTISPECIES: hypothetical protein [unclassified Microcoleus]|uniref:hypothetical protein n=1 Tax=unclassified Microcoleus TaxID=2642155 RepID=UPI002FD40674